MTHPQRCDSSCTFFDDTDEENRTFDLIYCEKIKRDIEPVFREESKSVGCASHSSAPVPDDLFTRETPASVTMETAKHREKGIIGNTHYKVSSEQSIRQDERGKVLDELVKFFTIGWFSKSKTVPRDVLIGKLVELRKQEQQG